MGDCAPEACPVAEGYLSYKPSVAGNALLLATFATLLPAAVFLGLRFRTRAFSLLVMTGCFLEVLGFAGRLLLRGSGSGSGGRSSSDGKNRAYFALYLAGTILGVTFFATAVFVVLPPTIAIHDERNPRFRPRHVMVLFTSLAGLVVILELAGILAAVMGDTSDMISRGANVLVAGLAVQLVSLILFTIVHVWFTLGLQRALRTDLSLTNSNIFMSPKFKLLLPIIQSIVLLLVATTLFRVIEIGKGLGSALAQDETALMTMAGLVPALAATILTAFHPGLAFGPSWGTEHAAAAAATSLQAVHAGNDRVRFGAERAAAPGTAVSTPYGAYQLPPPPEIPWSPPERRSSDGDRSTAFGGGGGPPPVAPPPPVNFRYQRVAPRLLLLPRPENMGVGGGSMTSTTRAPYETVTTWEPCEPSTTMAPYELHPTGDTRKELVDQDALW